ncbi:cation:proton antiporter [Occallatibacter riparius]|uniref:Cation:proton antiporter n=1 Tax=Occallatibacter riparius TaxID=1002689 RepID=A0A9J7BK17_9BACT|nr:cation:proton antiporter [Occallatibacter riparius]UWZ82122.1 cation:proton antiporter [Occallatibacter riparius]
MPANHLSLLFFQLGAAIIGLAILARLASRWGFSSISFYLLGGLAFGKGGLAPLDVSKAFIRDGAEIGVLLLLFMLGLEYSGAELRHNLKSGMKGGVIDLLLNFPPGFAAGLLLGWGILPSVLLGGVTLISSSGIISRVLTELKLTNAPETPRVLAILVLEDLIMAVYLPLVGVLIGGGGAMHIALSIAVATTAVALVLFIATRYGERLSALAAHTSDEVLLLTLLGTILIVAGGAESLQVSAAIGAFLVGIAVSGPVAERSYRMVTPLRDLFAAIFFFFFGLEIDPKSLLPALPVALVLGAVTAGTKILTGYWATRGTGIETRLRLRAGLTLVSRGEFSIVIAGLGVALEPKLGSLSAAYVLLMAVLGPVAARIVK